MAKFAIEFNQTPGCDYSIGCGTRVLNVDASSFDEIIEKIANGDYYALDLLSDIRIYEVLSFVDVDVEYLKRKQNEMVIAARKRAEEEAELKEYKRLQAKYGE